MPYFFYYISVKRVSCWLQEMNASVIYLVPFQEIFCKNIISATFTAFSYILVIRHGKVVTAVRDIVITPEFTLMSPLLLRYSSRTNLGRMMFESELGWFLGLCKLKFMAIYLRKFYFLSNAASSLRQTCAPGGLFSMALLLCVYSKQRPNQASFWWTLSPLKELTHIPTMYVLLLWYECCLREWF